MAPLRAVIDPTRRRILEGFHRRPDCELTVDEVSREQRVHRTVAFDHLELLVALGLLSTGSRHTGWRGKPARTYRLAAGAVEVSVPERRYRLLATLLADAIADLGVWSVAKAREGAQQAGAKLLAAAVPGADPLDVLRQLGGDHVLTDGAVHARNCVFKEVCVDAQAPTACAVQAGLIEGVLSTPAKPVRVVPAGADGAGGCVFTIEEVR
jgi:predicted ArsR family transcriptional regulator